MKSNLVLSLAAAATLAVSLIPGCTNTQATSPDGTVTTSTTYSYLKVDPADLTTNLVEVPAYSDVMAPNFAGVVPGNAYASESGDSLDCDSADRDHHGPPMHGRLDSNDLGRHDLDSNDRMHHDTIPPFNRDSLGHRGHQNFGRHFGGLIRDSYGLLIRQLNLTAAQDTAVRACLDAYRTCVSDAGQTFGAGRRALYTTLLGNLKAIHDSVTAGTLTRAQAKTEMDQLVADYRVNAKTLADAYAASAATCRATFKSCVASVLTADQLVIWNRYVR